MGEHMSFAAPSWWMDELMAMLNPIGLDLDDDDDEPTPEFDSLYSEAEEWGYS